MRAPCLMVQGTASHSGKSFLVTALCRLYAQAGVRVAPFKAQNMALNSFVTPEGGEIGRAQAVQAEAAMVAPHVDMNPILLKPTSENRAQVVMLGRPVWDMEAGRYWAEGFQEAQEVVASALDRLRQTYDLVLMEGAGSPAEVNLRERDLANMWVARIAEAPVLLVGDIERGGVFASLLGTLHLLPAAERRLVAGLVVNKFRGDISLFDAGRRFLEERSGVPVLGVLPYLPLELPAEDSLSLPEGRPGEGDLTVAVVLHPHIANFTDFDALRHTPGVRLLFTTQPEEVAHADAVVLPGTKNAVADLVALRARGLDEAIAAARARGATVVGLCGGLQMLGVRLEDPEGREGGHPAVLPGLGFLPLVTRYRAGKVTYQVTGQVVAEGFRGLPLVGYEVHSGESELLPGGEPFAAIERQGGEGGRVLDGAFVDRHLFGSYIHGLFDTPAFRRAFLAGLRAERGLPPLPEEDARVEGGDVFDRLAAAVRSHLDLALLERLTGIPL